MWWRSIVRAGRAGRQRGQTTAEYSVILGVMVLAGIAAYSAWDNAVANAMLARVATILTAF